MKLLKKFFKQIESIFEKISIKIYKFFLYKFFERKMPLTIEKYHNLKPNDIQEINHCIWVFWYQKIENAPDIVKMCIKSIQRNANGNKVVILTADNINNYVEFPEHINKKFKDGLITITHFSDLLRMALLSKYGGMWIDATIYVSKPIPKDCFELDYYSLHCNKWTFNEMTKGKWSSFLQASKSNSYITKFFRDMFFEYWMNSVKLCNYLLIDFVMSYGYDHYSYIKQAIDSIPENISDYRYCHVLRTTFSKKYNEKNYYDTLDKSIFSKLTYKKKFKLSHKGSITNYQHFIEENK